MIEQFLCLWNLTSFFFISAALYLPFKPPIKSPCFSFWHWIQYKYSQIPNYWNYIALLPITNNFYHYSVGKFMLFAVWVIITYSCGKASACWHSDPMPDQLFAGVSTQCIRVMVQSEVASLASLDWKGIQLKMNPSVFNTALFILSNAVFWQSQALFIHHCCHLPIHLATEFWIGVFTYLGRFFFAYLLVFLDTSTQYLFESEILNRQSCAREETGSEKE